MNKTVLGYIVVACFIFAAIFQFMANNILLGILFLLVAVANVYIFYKFRKISKGQK